MAFWTLRRGLGLVVVHVDDTPVAVDESSRSCWTCKISTYSSRPAELGRFVEREGPEEI